MIDLRGGGAMQRSMVSAGASAYSGSNPDCNPQAVAHGQAGSSVRPASSLFATPRTITAVIGNVIGGIVWFAMAFAFVALLGLWAGAI